MRFNRALIFSNGEDSWHGIPEKLTCPDGVLRRSLAFYWCSPLVARPSAHKVGASGGFRERAAFTRRPADADDARLGALLELRPQRRLTAEDVEAAWPGWAPELD